MSNGEEPENTGRTLKLIRSSHNLNDLPDRYAERFREAGARPAYLAGENFTPLMYSKKDSENFVEFATPWEKIRPIRAAESPTLCNSTA